MIERSDGEISIDPISKMFIGKFKISSFQEIIKCRLKWH